MPTQVVGDPQGAGTERNSIYKLKDNMFRFWYRFIPKNVTNIESGLGEQVFSMRVMPLMADYLGRIFEDISVEYLIRRNKAMALPFMFNSIGRWWGADPRTRSQEEIDILAEFEDNAIFGECKWRNEPVGVSVLEKLMEKSDILKHYKNRSYMLFSKSGFTEALEIKAKEMKNVELVNLDKMFEMP